MRKVKFLMVVLGAIIVGNYSYFIQHDSINNIYYKIILVSIFLYLLSSYYEDKMLRIISKGKYNRNKK